MDDVKNILTGHVRDGSFVQHVVSFLRERCRAVTGDKEEKIEDDFVLTYYLEDVAFMALDNPTPHSFIALTGWGKSLGEGLTVEEMMLSP